MHRTQNAGTGKISVYSLDLKAALRVEFGWSIMALGGQVKSLEMGETFLW